ncbi:TIGR04219 family outer membrane beta-barrel protein [Marinobacter sp. 1Y8]
MRKIAIVMLGGLTCLSPYAAADVLGLGANIGYWDTNSSGTATNKNSVVDVDDDLNLDSDSNVNLTAIFEHPIPIIPNFRLNYTSISQSGNGQLTTGYDNLPAGVPVHSELDLDQIDLTMYYELLDNWVNLDAGLTVRSLDGKLTVQERTGTVTASKTEVDAIVPMLYAAARFDLPLTGLSVGAEGSGIKYSDDTLFDVSAYAQFDISIVRLQAGYRQMTVDYEDGDDALDVDIAGPYASVGLDF